MKVFCPQCVEEMIKIKVREKINVKHYYCNDCGVSVRIEE